MEDLILIYIKAASNLYGFTTIPVITDMIYYYEEIDIEEDHILEIIKQQSKRNIYKDYDLISEGYISFSIKDIKGSLDLIKTLERNHITEPVYFPDVQEFLSYANIENTKDTIAFKQVYNYVIKNKLSYFDNKKTEENLLGLIAIIANSASFDEIVKYLDRISIKVREHTHREFYALLNYLYNNTRMYAYNGYTITEYQSLR